MKSILILSYHALPMDVIASYRANAYLKHLHKFGYYPTLVTHHWENDISNPDVVFETHDFGKVIRLPHKTVRFWSWWSDLEKIPVANKIFILARWMAGHLDSNPKVSMSSYHCFKSFIYNHLKNNRYDLSLGIFSPHHHLRLCYEINSRFGIPYVLDFRDLWNNQAIQKHYQPSISEKIQDLLFTRHWQKWLNHGLLFSITSEAWMAKINEFTRTKGVVITNGFDPEDFEVNPKSERSRFRIVHAGSLYTHQPLDIFLRGCRLFIDRKKPLDFIVSFIGAVKPGLLNNKTSFLYEPKKKILSILPESHCEVTGRIPKKRLIHILQSSQVLLFPGLPDSPGTHLGKIFDYIASGVNILLTPDDHDVVGDLIRQTRTGTIANTPEEVCQYLTKQYHAWSEEGTLKYEGIDEKIKQYSRAAQVEKMAESIKIALPFNLPA